ncbi:uncharacterized protein LY79DRAFT_350522 [Colletotrichum navitas]|uniref:Uncharacterized protein n=1 Tax=Colletotrichum navitas TaxID=681940 RepID=A0AAD8Q853_9PEZI|nr:uncharacterized protein LY79DRAFT_350522 [Colletotrichum navitas]KAK1597622.1 hypothetical protein LY79DRAFT_350522 [Colletotrichum navitas]
MGCAYATTGQDADLPIHPCSLPVRTFLPEMDKLVGRGMGLFNDKDPMTASCLPQLPLASSALDFITDSTSFSLPSFASRIFFLYCSLVYDVPSYTLLTVKNPAQLGFTLRFPRLEISSLIIVPSSPASSILAAVTYYPSRPASLLHIDHIPWTFQYCQLFDFYSFSTSRLFFLSLSRRIKNLKISPVSVTLT